MSRKVTIVIPTLGAPHLIDCLRGIFDNVKPEQEFDVIIVKNDVKGYSVPTNRAIKLADPESDIILIDDDTVLNGPFIEKFQEALKPGMGILSHEIYEYLVNGKQFRRASFHLAYIPRETVDAIGPLDEEMPLFANDLDYCLRIEHMGLSQQKVKIDLIPGMSKTLGDTQIFPDAAQRQAADNKKFEEAWGL